VRSTSRFACLPAFSKIGSIVFLLLLAGWADTARAQTTAHFSGAMSNLASALNSPNGVAVDNSGNVFFTSQGGNAVYELAAVNGVIPAGSTPIQIGTANGNFNAPDGVAVDANGNVFVADTGHNSVKEILASGGYTTVNPIGSGFSGPQGLAVDAHSNVFVADSGNNSVKEILATSGAVSSSSTVNQISSGFSFGQPVDVAVDATGNVFVADYNNSAVYEIVATSGVVSSSSTVTPIGSGFSGPNGVSVDGNGNVFVADYGNNAVKEIVAAGGYTTVNTFGNGFNQPTGVAVDGRGNVFVADQGNSAVKEIMTQGVNFGAASVATTTPLTLTLTFTLDTGTLNSTTPYKVLTQGQTQDAQGNPLDFAAVSSSSTCSGTVSAGNTCTVSVTFTPKRPGARYGAVVLLDTSGNAIATAYVYGTGQGAQISYNQGSNPGTLPTPLGAGKIGEPYLIATDAAGNVFVADYGNNAVEEITAASGYATVNTLARLNGTDTGNFKGPIGVAVDGAGNVFVSDSGNQSVKEILAAGNYTTVNTLAQANGNFSDPIGVAVDGAGNVFVSDSGNQSVKKILAAGNYTTVNTLAQTNGSFSGPAGIAVDSNGNLFVVNSGNYYVEEILAAGGYTGTPIWLALNYSPFTYPVGLALDANENVYIVNYVVGGGSTSVQEILAAGGYQGAPISLATNSASASSLTAPIGIALDGNGNIFVSNFSTSQGTAPVVKLDYADPPTNLTFATPTNVGTVDADPAQTVTVANIGNEPLTFTTPPSGGTNPSYPANFPINPGSTGDTNPLCATSLAIGASCDVSAIFQPTDGGTNSGNIVLTDDALNVETAGVGSAMQNIALSGTGKQTGDTTSVAIIPTSSSLVYGQTEQFQVTVRDTSNPSSAASGTVTITDSAGGLATTQGPFTLGGGIPGGDGSVSTGVITPFYTPTVGTHTITANYTPTPSSSFAPSSNTTGTSITVAAFDPTLAMLQVAVTNSPVYAGVADTVTVTPLDQYGNTITNYTGSVVLSSTDTAATLGAVTFIGGVGTATVTFATPGTPTVTATAGAITGVSSAATVNAPPRYVVTVNTDATTGTASNCTDQNQSGATPDASCSLRDAVTAADAVSFVQGVSSSVAITFDPSVFATAQTITLVNGQLELSQNVTIAGPASGSGSTPVPLVTVSGNDSSRVFSVDSEVTASISSLAIVHGKATGTSGGGGVHNDGALTIANSTISSNQAINNQVLDTGPTITCSTNPSTVNPGDSSTITASGVSAQNLLLTYSYSATAGTVSGNGNVGNVATFSSVDVAPGSVVTITCNVVDSLGMPASATATVTVSAPPPPPAFRSSSTLDVTPHQQTNASAKILPRNDSAAPGSTGGGGIYNDGTLILSNSTISGNTATATSEAGGGGISNVGALTIGNSTIANNSVTAPTQAGGGGLYSTGSLTVSNSTISGNTVSMTSSTSLAGGIGVAGGTAAVTNSTVSGNSAVAGGGIGVVSGTLTLANDIVAGNTASTSPDCYNCATQSAPNVIGGTPNLGPLAFNGGSTQTMLPLFGSAAIGAGIYQSGEPATDQRGLTRPTSGAIDAGAVQVSGNGATITSVSPSAGSVAGGTSVTITGSGFTGATAVYFGTTSVTPIVNSDTSITATAPAGTAGTVDTSVITLSGTSTINAADKYTYVAVPVVTGISPSTGPFAGGTSVTITGSGFTGATEVIFGSSPAASFTVVSDTQIMATAPAGASASVPITVTTAIGTSATSNADLFTYVDTFAGFIIGTSATGPVPAGVAQSITVTAVGTLGETLASYSGTVHFTSSDGSAVLPADATLVNGVGSFSVTFLTAGQQTITATDVSSSLNGTSGNFSVQRPAYVVTVATDSTTGVAANCVNPNISTAGNDNCSLRDAITAANGLTGVSTNISFSATAFATAQTITLANGVLTLNSNMTITGATSGNGVSLTNLVTVDGNHLSGVFKSNSGMTTSLADLIIANGQTDNANSGSGIWNQGALTVANSTLSGNSTTNLGGGIYNTGILTVTNSTLSGNSAPGNLGGGIYNTGILTVTNSTLSGNSAYNGGGLYTTGPQTVAVTNSTFSGNQTASGSTINNSGNAGALILANNIVSGNTAPELLDINSYTDKGGNIVGGAVIQVAPLGNYGGPTQTMPPQIGSPALGAGAYQTGESTTDQRGYPRPNTASAPIDSGAVQVSGNGATITAVSPSAGPVAGGTVVTVTGSGFTGATAVYFGGTSVIPTVTSDTSITVTAPAGPAGAVAVVVVTPAGISAANASATYTYSALSVTAGSAVVTLTVGTAASVNSVTVTGGTSPFTYSISPALPAGLSFNTSTGAITQTPTAASAATNYTVTVTDSNSVSNTASFMLAVNKATPTITTLPTASAITYGQTLASSTLSGGVASVAGTFTWTTSSTAPNAGTPSYSITFTPTDTTDYNTATGSVSVTVNKATPTITTPPTASAITYGQTLASSTLNGGVASVAGTFAWTTTSTVPSTGTPSYSITFTPTDTTDYNTATGSVSVTVNKATPTITTLPTASAITYGQTLVSSTLSGGAASVAGTFTWTTSSTKPNAGTPSYSITFTPTDTTDYNTATGTVSVKVNKATPTITTSPTASAITYSQTLASSTLSGGVASVAGTFAWTTSSTAPTTGTASYSITFTPTDMTDYNTATGTVSVTVNKATPTITTPPTASAITYGQTLASSTLSGGVASVAGTFTWTTSSTAPSTGTASYSVTFTPTDTTDYNTATGSVSVTVNQALQTVTFAQPTSPVTYGSANTVALSATGGASGNAVTFSVASGPGSISGSTLTITGTGTIVINANQAGSTNYSAATQVQRSLAVTKASSTLTGPAAQPVKVVDAQTGVIPVTVAGQYIGAGIAIPGNTISYTVSGNAFAPGTAAINNGVATISVPNNVAPGTYTVTVTYAGDSNYAAATPISVSLQVGQIQPTISWSQPGAINYGATLGSILGAVAQNNSTNIPGTEAYTATASTGGAIAVTSATVLPAGSYTLTVNFTPMDTTTYKTATGTVSLTVNKILPSVILNVAPNPVLVENTVTLTATVSSAVSAPTGMVSFYDGASSTALGSSPVSGGVATLPVSTLSVGTHSITAIYSGDGNFLTQTSSPVSENVQDFSLSLSTSAGSTISQTVVPGGTASYAFVVSPVGGSTFPAPVSFTVSGLPTGAIATFTPQTLAAGSGTTNVTLSVQVPSLTASLKQDHRFGGGFVPVALGMLLLPFSRRLRRSARKLGRGASLALLLLLSLGAVAGLTGCGAGNGFFAQPQRTYNVTVTATSGALTHSSQVMLTVE
jgi:hypothetical protein